ncbi:MAG: hypothetical protein P9M07_09050 [Candidatus Aceula meridiana]|nr:hypothetical protein [Candidatus Aceula meridiana]
MKKLLVAILLLGVTSLCYAEIPSEYLKPKEVIEMDFILVNINISLSNLWDMPYGPKDNFMFLSLTPAYYDMERKKIVFSLRIFPDSVCLNSSNLEKRTALNEVSDTIARAVSWQIPEASTEDFIVDFLFGPGPRRDRVATFKNGSLRILEE